MAVNITALINTQPRGPAGPAGTTTQSSMEAAITDPQAFRVSINGPGVINVLDYGAIADCVSAADMSISSGDATLTSPTAEWTAADAGKPIVLFGVGAAGATVRTTIASVNSLHSIELAATVSTTVAGTGGGFWGTNNDAALAAAAAALNTQGGTLLVPSGGYLFTEMLTVYGPLVKQQAAGLGGLWFPNTNRGNFVLQGTGQTSRLYFAGTGAAVRIQNPEAGGTTGYGVQNLTKWRVKALSFVGPCPIDGSYWDETSVGLDCYTTSNDSSVEECYFTNWGEAGLRAFDQTTVTLARNTFHFNKRGLAMGYKSDVWTLIGNSFAFNDIGAEVGYVDADRPLPDFRATIGNSVVATWINNGSGANRVAYLIGGLGTRCQTFLGGGNEGNYEADFQIGHEPGYGDEAVDGVQLLNVFVQHSTTYPVVNQYIATTNLRLTGCRILGVTNTIINAAEAADDATVEISAGGGNYVLSNDTSIPAPLSMFANRSKLTFLTVTTNASVPLGSFAFNDLPWSGAVTDESLCYNNTTKRWTAKIPCQVRVSTAFFVNPDGGGTTNGYVRHYNAAEGVIESRQFATSSGYAMLSGSTVITLQAGEYIKLGVSMATSNGGVIPGADQGAGANWCQIEIIN